MTQRGLVEGPLLCLVKNFHKKFRVLKNGGDFFINACYTGVRSKGLGQKRIINHSHNGYQKNFKED